MYLYIYVCIYVCIYIGKYIYMYIYIHIYVIYIHTVHVGLSVAFWLTFTATVLSCCIWDCFSQGCVFEADPQSDTYWPVQLLSALSKARSARLQRGWLAGHNSVEGSLHITSFLVMAVPESGQGQMCCSYGCCCGSGSGDLSLWTLPAIKLDDGPSPSCLALENICL